MRIGYPLPTSVDVCGVDVPINISHRCGIRVASILDDPAIDSEVATIAVLENYFFGVNVPITDELWDAAMWFFFCGSPPKVKRPSHKTAPKAARVWDWEIDAWMLVADFQRDYGLDLTDPEMNLHWWRFKALYDGLGDTSYTFWVKGVRSRSLSDCKSKDERETLRRQKQAVKLPPRTASEVTLEI